MLPNLSPHYNSVHPTETAVAGFDPSGSQPSLADRVHATDQDFDSVDVDPVIQQQPGHGTWTLPSGSHHPDMHFTAFPGPEYLAPHSPGVDYDFDGAPRPGPDVLIGAHEVAPLASSIGNWHLY